jgi:hypothetical protein
MQRKSLIRPWLYLRSKEPKVSAMRGHFAALGMVSEIVFQGQEYSGVITRSAFSRALSRNISKAQIGPVLFLIPVSSAVKSLVCWYKNALYLWLSLLRTLRSKGNPSVSSSMKAKFMVVQCIEGLTCGWLLNPFKLNFFCNIFIMPFK